jgi:hypothetical protein
MIGTTDDFFRFIVGGLLRGDYNGKSVCSPCLVKLIRERLRTNYSTLKIERALGRGTSSPPTCRPASAMLVADGWVTAGP